MKKLFYISLFFLLSIFLVACGNTTDKQTKETTTEPTNNAQPAQDESKNEKVNFVYTAEHGGITKVDAATNKTIKSIDIEGSVHNVQISPDGRILGATVVPEIGEHGGHDSGHEEKTNGFALFYDVETDQLINKVEVGSHPAHIVFTENMKYALVTNNEDNNVSVIDLTTYKMIQNISTGNGPHGFRIAADSKTAYIANMGEDTVSVIDLESMKESKKIVVGNTPVTTSVTPDGKNLVVTLNAENSLAIINLENDNVEKVQVGEGPAQVYIQSDGKYAFVANQGTPENPSDSVSKIDLETRKIVTTIKVGKGAHGIVTSDDNQFVYVTNMYENTVSVIDNNENKVIATIEVGTEPNGITLK
ncbi:YncE family protein [Bacillus sp. 7884-1]|uniref:YncE family protein n=1 Tax=Bacillus sp. 7884-1 TaxID=2021693 RepID=UPI000BA55B4D|nr:YncE family protein [Bacillus sp. 7884-1]PAE36666.1 40-residue YVTN family beta-propeller [Bacillus sp. 7884-1]